MNSRTKAIFTPWIDTLCAGGLSIVVIGILLTVDSTASNAVLFSRSILIATLLNFPHFMASYRLLYSSKTQVRRYPAASIVIPAILVMYGIASLVLVVHDARYRVLIDALLVLTSYYLAQHYTGQTWGMMASFAYLDGVSFSKVERATFRNGLRILLVWQVVWATSYATQLPYGLPEYAQAALPFLNVALIATLLAGGGAFFSMMRRTDRFPPLRVLTPFLAIFLWYSLMYKHPSALFWVQNAHALQYLVFPLRVELNRRNSNATVVHSLLKVLPTYLTLVATGFFLFYGFEKILSYDGRDFKAYITVLVSCINIHHFFIDGCIWKISNPIVKEELFAHLKAN